VIKTDEEKMAVEEVLKVLKWNSKK
jgi:hypothetical protein